MALSRESSIIIHWPEAELSDAQKEDLDELFSVINYLGRSESWAAARLSQVTDAAWNCVPVNDSDELHDTEIVQVACTLPRSAYASKPFMVPASKKGKPTVLGWLDALAMSASDLLDYKLSEPPAFQSVMYLRPASCFDARQSQEAAKYEPKVKVYSTA